jgi:uncharacterized protein YutE (UPF0331/DUF86 family)/predicted nucleotidyltransferase
MEIEKLKEFFFKKSEVILAFLFGSGAENRQGKISDWDIGIYLKAKKLEWEEEKEYPLYEKIWDELMEFLKTDKVDLILLNKAPLYMVGRILNQGIPLCIKDEKVYLKLLTLGLEEEERYREFVDSFYKICQQATSLSIQVKETLKKIIIFVEEEMTLYPYFEKFTFKDYQDIHKCLEIERWVENLINSSIDIGKIILASKKEKVPDYYREIFLRLSQKEEFQNTQIIKIAQWIKLRNILAHEYLNIKWESIEKFIKESKPILEEFLKKVKELIEK